MFVDDDNGISLVAYHYSINKQLTGVNPGDYNEDVTSPTGRHELHNKESPKDSLLVHCYLLLQLQIN